MDLRHTPAALTISRLVPRVAAVLATLLLLATAAPLAQRGGYPPEEFGARRQRLAAGLGRAGDDGMIVLFGATADATGSRFRQDNDFYYLTGSEDLDGVAVIDVPSGDTRIFLPRRSAVQVRYEGANWLDEADGTRRHGVTDILPLSSLHEFLSRRHAAGTTRLWLRLSEPDTVDRSREETAMAEARRRSHPFAQHPSEQTFRIAALREQFPYFELRDVTPGLDRLRLIKTAREIETLRRNGRISAEAIARAIGASTPGAYEYEIEAEATYWLVRHGAQGPAYAAIVGSGANGNEWHYRDNGRRTAAGDLVVMDYAGSLDYLTVDITRTWPVSGRFSERQARAYACVLEAQQALIAAMRPGVTREVLQERAEQVYQRHGFDPRYAYVGHYVGMAVHDVGDWNAPLEAGMVLAIEPMIDLPEEQLHIRVEDTVLVTATGAEVLTAAVPKAVQPLLALVGSRQP